MIAVLESSPSCSWMVLVPTSPDGFTDDWLDIFKDIESLLSDSSLVAASISLMYDEAISTKQDINQAHDM